MMAKTKRQPKHKPKKASADPVKSPEHKDPPKTRSEPSMLDIVRGLPAKKKGKRVQPAPRAKAQPAKTKPTKKAQPAPRARASKYDQVYYRPHLRKDKSGRRVHGDPTPADVQPGDLVSFWKDGGLVSRSVESVRGQSVHMRPMEATIGTKAFVLDTKPQVVRLDRVQEVLRPTGAK